VEISCSTGTSFARLSGNVVLSLVATRTEFAGTVRERITIDGRRYRRDQFRAPAQHVEVADGEACIVGSNSELLRIPSPPVSGAKPATPGVRSSAANWRRERNPAPTFSREMAHFP